MAGSELRQTLSVEVVEHGEKGDGSMPIIVVGGEDWLSLLGGSVSRHPHTVEAMGSRRSCRIREAQVGPVLRDPS